MNLEYIIHRRRRDKKKPFLMCKQTLDRFSDTLIQKLHNHYINRVRKKKTEKEKTGTAKECN